VAHRATLRFWQAYDSLPANIRERADQQFERLKTNTRHPSLQFKKIGESQGKEVWSARVTLDFRALAVKTGTDFLWFWIGDHKTYDKLL
jgi:hypothetical protein